MPREDTGGVDPKRLLEFLLLLARGLPLHEAARRLGLNARKTDLILAALLSEGYIAEAGRGLECICESCVIRGICGGRILRGGSGIRSYILTEKGKALVARLASEGLKD